MNIHLRKIEDHEVPLFRREMKSAFEQGVYDRFGALDAAPIPPENEVDEALKDPQFDVFIITADGESAGGTIIKKEGEGRYSLDLLFSMRGMRIDSSVKVRYRPCQ